MEKHVDGMLMPSAPYNITGLTDLERQLDASEDVEESRDCKHFEFLLCVVVVGILCILGITGNITSFVVLWKHKTETATMFLLQVLAVSDSLLLLASIFIYVLPNIYPYTNRLRIFYDSFMIIQTYIWPMSLMTHTTTVWVTVLVSLNRYYAICHMIGPLRSYVLKATKLQVIAVVSFAVLYNTPRFFEHQKIREEKIVTYDGNQTNISYDPYNLGDSKLYQVIYSNVTYFPVMYIVPLVLLSWLNVKLIRALNIIKLRKEQLTGHKARDDHITLVIIVIVFVFILCQTPALVNQIFWATVSKIDRKCGHFHFYYTRISDVLVVLNSSTNFVIYCLFGKTFRRVFVETLCKRNIYRAHRGTTMDPSSVPLREIRELRDMSQTV